MSPRLSAAALLVILAHAPAGAFGQTPVFTQLPSFNSLQIIGLHVSEDGQTACGFVSGNTSFIWRVNGNPQIVTVSGPGGNGDVGVHQSVTGMDGSGTKFLFGYRDPSFGTTAVYTGGLIGSAIYENEEFTLLPNAPFAAPCDQSIMTPWAMSLDGSAVSSSAWKNCRVTPYVWREATGFVQWATQDTFPPPGQPGYESHKVNVLSGNGSRGAGWFQSGTGYGGRTALVWLNNGAEVRRLDEAPHSGLWGEASAISSDGKYVVGFGVPPSLLPSEEQADSNKYIYRWTLEEGVQVLGKVVTSPGSGRHPVPSGISTNGRIIIGQDSFGFDREAFIWTPETGGIKLTDYLASKGLNLADQFITLTSAAGCSSDGRYITGQWTDLGGSIGPYVLDLGVQTCGAADLGSAGGFAGADNMLDNNDFIAFINLFFESNAGADLGVAGGLPGQDGLFDNNDFIAFINLFFQGC